MTTPEVPEEYLETIVASAHSVAQKLGPDAHQERRCLEPIVRAANRMNKLVADLLDQHVIDRGQLSIDVRSWPPSVLVEEVAEAQKSQIEAASLSLEVSLPEGLPLVLADKDRIQQVFENLISNAVKLTPAGGRVTLGAAPNEDGVRFFVTDSGPGFAPETLSQIFDRYWRARSSGHLSTGLGLSICKGIVDAHGGRIWAANEPGQGATIAFTLPEARA